MNLHTLSMVACKFLSVLNVEYGLFILPIFFVIYFALCLLLDFCCCIFFLKGSDFGFHTMTLGLYMDELVRRVDPHHRRLDQFFREEISQQFGTFLFSYSTLLCYIF